jgi:hypothetical protein
MAQENTEKEEAFRPHSQVSLVVSHAHVFEGSDEYGNKKVISLPSWGIDFNYWFHPNWAVGLQTDIIMEEFEVQKVMFPEAPKKQLKEAIRWHGPQWVFTKPHGTGVFHWVWEPNLLNRKILRLPVPELNTVQASKKTGKFSAPSATTLNGLHTIPG